MGIFEESRQKAQLSPMRSSKKRFDAFRFALPNWPTVTVLSISSLLMCAPEAHAGQWSFQLETAESGSVTQWDSSTSPPAPGSSTPGQAKTTPFNGNNSGFLKYDGASGPFGVNDWANNSFSYSRSLSGIAQYGVGVSLNQTILYTLRLHYTPDSTIPNDVPPKVVVLQLAGTAGGHYAPPPAGYTSGAASLTGSTGLNNQPTITGTNRGVSVDINGYRVLTYANPTQQADITISNIPLDNTSAWLTGHLPNAYKSVILYDRSGNSTGSIKTYAQQEIEGINALSGSFCSLLPNPNNLALDDGSGSKAPLNQYVISSTMPTSVGWGNPNQGFADWLKNNVSWNLVGTAPNLRPVDTKLTSPSSVAPGHYPQVFPTPHPAPAPNATPAPAPPPVASPGFDFDVRTSASPSSTSNDGWNFPLDNSSFGVKTFNHVIAGTTIPADVALFYPATGFQHPSGGPKGWVHIVGDNGYHAYEIPTPNWFYYYSKAFPVPNGYTINYRDTSGSGETPGEDHIHIGNDAHNLLITRLFALVNGKLQAVGDVHVRGIDAYARVITHESYHRAMRAKYGFQWGDDVKEANDWDDDGVPDDFEASTSTGLRPDKNDSTGWGGENGYDKGNGDWEVCARLAEYRVFGDEGQDWADDGLNCNIGMTSRLQPPNVFERAAFTFDDTTKSKGDYIFPHAPPADGEFTVE